MFLRAPLVQGVFYEERWSVVSPARAVSGRGDAGDDFCHHPCAIYGRALVAVALRRCGRGWGWPCWVLPFIRQKRGSRSRSGRARQASPRARQRLLEPAQFERTGGHGE